MIHEYICQCILGLLTNKDLTALESVSLRCLVEEELVCLLLMMM